MVRILDLGAGTRPIRGATHAIDFESRDVILEERRVTGEGAFPSGLKYTFNVDWTRRLPFPDEFFDRVVSRFALGSMDLRPQAFRNVRRVLKTGGIFQIAIDFELGDEEGVIEKLKRAGRWQGRVSTSSGDITTLFAKKV